MVLSQITMMEAFVSVLYIYIVLTLLSDLSTKNNNNVSRTVGAANL